MVSFANGSDAIQCVSCVLFCTDMYYLRPFFLSKGLFHFHAAATVTGRPIIVSYPESDVLQDERQYVSRRIEGLGRQRGDEPLVIQWTASNALSCAFNHLVPLVR